MVDNHDIPPWYIPDGEHHLGESEGCNIDIGDTSATTDDNAADEPREMVRRKRRIELDGFMKGKVVEEVVWVEADDSF